MPTELVWNTDDGIGFFDCDKYIAENKVPEPYDEAYFSKYHGYSETEMGRQINNFRLKTVNRFTSGLVVDIGIGSGQFVEARNALGMPTLGTDVNPVGIAWLKERGLEANLDQPIPVITCFDSLEHIRDHKPLLDKVTKFFVTSIPIFEDYRAAYTSKHFRKTEHFWYYSHRGLVSTLWNRGLRLVEYTDYESELGREGIRTYVFKRT